MRKSTDSKMRKVTPPSPSYMTNDQFGKMHACIRECSKPSHNCKADLIVFTVQPVTSRIFEAIAPHDLEVQGPSLLEVVSLPAVPASPDIVSTLPLKQTASMATSEHPHRPQASERTVFRLDTPCLVPAAEITTQQRHLLL